MEKETIIEIKKNGNKTYLCHGKNVIRSVNSEDAHELYSAMNEIANYYERRGIEISFQA